jgi:TatD DNase family protein
MTIIDTHAHLDMPEFEADRQEVIARAHEAGVAAMVTIGIDLPSCRQAIALAEANPGVWAAVGIHPQETKGVKKEDVDQLESLAKHPRVVGIGELGLDFYRHYSPQEDQMAILKLELEVAGRVGLPIIVHCRQAQNEMLPILQSWAGALKLPSGKATGVLHCFNGDTAIAEKYLEMGFYISVGAYIGYPSSSQLRETLKSVPLNRLVIETDCPFLPPQKYRGQRNEPVYTLITAGVLAEIKGLTSEEIAGQTTQNAIKLFNLTGIE